MKRDEIWRSITIKATAIYNGAEYAVIGYTYKHLTKAREAIILKDLRANSIIEAPIDEVELKAQIER